MTALAIPPLVVTSIERLQDRETAAVLPHEGHRAGGAAASAQRSAVVFYSRSGNTALLARHLAQLKNARLFQLEAQDYALGLVGWANALNDAQNHQAGIAPQIVDLSAYDTVYLGSPIWMFSPAPTLWQFVGSQRFDGKRVVLVNTFNSRFKAEFIDEFSLIVLRRGARSFEHQFVRRGRMGWQLSPQEMLDSFDARLSTWESAFAPVHRPTSPFSSTPKGTYHASIITTQTPDPHGCLRCRTEHIACQRPPRLHG